MLEQRPSNSSVEAGDGWHPHDLGVLNYEFFIAKKIAISERIEATLLVQEIPS